MDAEQVELHRKIRINVNRKTVERIHRPLLKDARERVDAQVALITDEVLQNKLRIYLMEERNQFPHYATIPPWLAGLADRLQVTQESPGSDPNANAVQAIRLLLKRSTSLEKKMVAIKKIIGDACGESSQKDA